MSKKDKKKKDIDFNFDHGVIDVNIGDINTEVMQIFGANNNLMRHIPSVIDGIKPGERRILYAMYLNNAMPNKKYKKALDMVGQTAKFHPHGDGPIADSMIKMAQKWSNIEPLLDMDGNVGNSMGANAAHPRYLDVRLTKYAYKCFFEEFDKDLVDMRPSFMGDIDEPEYLPARYPNTLINSTFGIGYGTASGLPTYNLREVLELTLKLLDDPDYEDVTLIPDSPTWADIVDEGQFRRISETGEGNFKMRGEIVVDEETNNIIIRSVPLQVSMVDVLTSKRKKDKKDGKMATDIKGLHAEGKIPGLIDFKWKTGEDSDSPSEFDVTLLMKKEVDPYSVLSTIYTRTQLQKTFPVIFKLIDEDYNEIKFNIRSFILTWLDYRRDFKRRVYNHKIIKARERQHILKTLLMIFDGKNAEEALQTIRKSETTAEAVQYLMKTFKITSLQAKNIAEMSLIAFSKESIKKYKKENEKLEETVAKYDKIIRSQKKIDKIIREELEEGIQLFGAPRRSRVITIEGEAKVRETDHVVVFTYNGYVKKLPIETDQIGFVNNDDHPIEIIRIKNTEDLMIFDETGKISKLPIHTIPNSELNSEGSKLSEFCTINGQIKSIIARPTLDALKAVKEPVYLVMVTRNGIVKKTTASSYVNIKNELLGMAIKEGDELQVVKLMIGDKDMLIYTNAGMGVRFNGAEVKDTKRMSIGVKALELSPDEVVIGMDIVNEKDKSIFVLTSRGTGKKCTLDNFPTMDRAAKPLRITSLESNEEVVLMRTVKGTEKFKAYLSTGSEEIDVKEVMELPRLSKGRKLIPVPKGSVIIDIKEIR